MLCDLAGGSRTIAERRSHTAASADGPAPIDRSLASLHRLVAALSEMHKPAETRAHEQRAAAPASADAGPLVRQGSPIASGSHTLPATHPLFDCDTTRLLRQAIAPNQTADTVPLVHLGLTPTPLLRHAVGGNSRTAVLVSVSPALCDLPSTRRW